MCQINIAIFASGSGTNAENLIKHFSNSKYIKVVLILSNKNDALVLEKARNLTVPSYTFSPFVLNDTMLVDSVLDKYKVDSLILAGFLLKIPNRIIERYRDQIINIHPSLLPKYGGKGMYGLKVHKAVIDACERESGITINIVDEVYVGILKYYNNPSFCEETGINARKFILTDYSEEKILTDLYLKIDLELGNT